MAVFERVVRGVAEEGVYRVENHRHGSSSAVAGGSAIFCGWLSVLVGILSDRAIPVDVAEVLYGGGWCPVRLSGQKCRTRSWRGKVERDTCRHVKKRAPRSAYKLETRTKSWTISGL